jgi:hypothetical protein
MAKYFLTHLQENVSNGSRVIKFLRTFFQEQGSNGLSATPCSSFKKLILSSPRLIQGLRTMSLAKAVPNGIKDKECKRFVLQEHLPVSYVPVKDPVSCSKK